MKESVGDYKYVKKGCKQALRHLLRIRNQNYFTGDVDAFEQFVRDRLSELNDRRAGDERFPVQGLGGAPNYRYVDNRETAFWRAVRDDRAERPTARPHRQQAGVSTSSTPGRGPGKRSPSPVATPKSSTKTASNPRTSSL